MTNGAVTVPDPYENYKDLVPQNTFLFMAVGVYLETIILKRHTWSVYLNVFRLNLFLLFFIKKETGSCDKDKQLLIMKPAVHCAVILHLLTFLYMKAQKEDIRDRRE